MNTSTCKWGKHVVTEDVKQKLRDKLPNILDVKCGNPSCDNYLRLVKEYDDTYFVESIGRKKPLITH